MDLVLLVGLQHPDLVISLHHAHGLDKHRSPAAGSIVYQAGDLTAKFRLDRHHIPPAPLGDDAFLQMLLMALGVDQLVQLISGPGGGVSDLPPDRSERRRSAVRHFLLVQNTGEDFFFQIFIGCQNREPAGKGVLHALAFSMPLRQGTNGPKGPGNIEKLPKAQPAACLGPAQGVGHVFQAVKGGRAEFCHQHKGRICLL